MAFRKEQLRNMLKMFEECSVEMLDALKKDLRKAHNEGNTIVNF